MRLALELRASRMIRTMNQHMAVEAGARVHLRARGGGSRLLDAVSGRHVAAGEVGAAVDLIAVVTAVALLAQPGRASLEERRVDRSVRRVATGATVDDRGVLPEEGAALLRVARVTRLVHRLLDEQRRPGRPGRVVAVRARHLGRRARAGRGQRVSRKVTNLGSLRLVAAVADFGLGGLALDFLVRGAGAVAIGAGDALAFMLAAGPVVPRQHVLAVTRETRGVPLSGRRAVLRLDVEDHVRGLRGVLQVGVALPVTALAAGCAGIGLVAVAGLIDRRHVARRRIVTRRAGRVLRQGGLPIRGLVGSGGYHQAADERQGAETC